MSLTLGLRSLSRGALAARNALPKRAGAGGPVKLSPPVDKPLPYNYDFWMDNGIYPGQPIYDGMFGSMVGNMSLEYMAKGWLVLLPILSAPFVYEHCIADDVTRNPFVPRQYPSEVREFLALFKNGFVLNDYSQPDYEEMKRRQSGLLTPIY
uniref:Uncharacterized protein n=1 Tax=Polytomella parva TaxID=51329 RepID=A0A7S0YPK2_9CHLO|nr:Chain l, ASHI [Polytomella sp. Pringsheim 198.80]7ARD_l Chain l, ASHI [Polytomella sp. Pringsheim 198.80]|mmetsp:Transcript_31301/g.56803  ORF Transcript_31301/g.56803 Transcript_31301/m.56803 type:complete len:152 (+) Transcript_31301:40-495(+)|eukprot:CAMPEP_0175057750 /NCGR_PEP_ID=MMETSP0052_2-20121109/11440_1 /TAXON_ID=51329 ORGANISM="Polytomella parva, Strain SAG 63-3" /NCGR_SAMPLE_ID=MMETSP0052_2 /ASSEMBLY_ACC=CAM_ASM_000194 /LENGTH=151 /DNA_ID=CAMNT_0016323003 /DNA_START=17 /DNA_END=472 /DNA_ORIENTATION=+